MEDQPPIFKNWSSWYWLLMIVLAVQIVGYYFITRAFS
jgi:hypothetical protein